MYKKTTALESVLSFLYSYVGIYVFKLLSYQVIFLVYLALLSEHLEQKFATLL